MAKETRIGSLRWPVIVAERTQVPAPPATITEQLSGQYATRADIQPIGPMTYLQGQQTDRPITHRVYMRWLDWIDETFVIVRQTQRLDHTWRTETFRIRRIKEVDGRKRFVELEVELETRQ